MIENQNIITKYYRHFSEESFKKQMKFNFHLEENMITDQEIIIAFLDDLIVGFLSFYRYCYLSDKVDSFLIMFVNINECYDVKKIINKLYSKLFIIARCEPHLIIIPENKYQKYLEPFNLELVYRDDRHYFVNNPAKKLNRLVTIGDLKTGVKNNICDVEGVNVGHVSIQTDEFHTGVTAIIPHPDNVFKEKVTAASFIFNGFGKSDGTNQINELGTIETPILLTNTLNVGLVSDALIEYVLANNPEIGISTGTVNAAVFECNDSGLNNIRKRIINQHHVFEAINQAKEDFEQGSIGAGSGMRCHGFKGGIGSSSRVIKIGNRNYTIGVLVNSNFNGNHPHHLVFKGRSIGTLISDELDYYHDDDGSIIVVIATDLPLDSRQLERLCKRSSLGVAKTGSYVSNGSGDIYVAFSTANKVPHFPTKPISQIYVIHDDYLELAFKAAVEATEEAILNSMLYSKTVIGYNNIECKSINEVIDLYDDLLFDVIT